MMHVFGGGQEVEILRDCRAIIIPDGSATELKKASRAYITQVLGGMFTVETENGYLVRIDGLDADALGQPVPAERKTKEQLASDGKSLEEMVWAQLRTCYDPEIPVNIVDLGLIYDCKVLSEQEDHRAEVQMTLTAPGCGMGEVLKGDIEQKLLDVPGIKSAHVEIVFDPAWESSMMSEAARLQLGMM